VFSHDLEFALKKHPLFPKNIEDFVAGFEKHCSENRNLMKVLTHTKVKHIKIIRLVYSFCILLLVYRFCLTCQYFVVTNVKRKMMMYV
jgi:hypothetical protein